MTFIIPLLLNWLDKNQIEYSDYAELQITLYDTTKINKKVMYQE